MYYGETNILCIIKIHVDDKLRLKAAKKINFNCKLGWNNDFCLFMKEWKLTRKLN